MKILNGFSSEWLPRLFKHKLLYVGFERIPGFTSSRNWSGLKFSQSIILNAFKYKMSRFLHFGGKLNTRGTVKTVLRDYYCDTLNVMFPQFPNHLIPFLMVFRHVTPSVSTFSSGVLQFPLSVSSVSYFRFCESTA